SFDKRRDPSLSGNAITQRVQDLLDKEIPEAKVSIYTPPPVSGLGSASGFQIIIEDLAHLGFAGLPRQIDRVIARSKESDKVEKLFSIVRANVPQLFVDVNRDQCASMGVNPKDVFDTLQIYLGSYYVNDFNRFGRTWQVIVQAEGEFRDDPDKIKLLKVRNAQGEMVPLGAIVSVRPIGGPVNNGPHNKYPPAPLLRATQPRPSAREGHPGRGPGWAPRP